MALTITSNFSGVAENTLLQMNKHQSLMGKTIEKVSTGLKLNHSKDNAVQFARAQRLDNDVDGMETVKGTLQSSSSYLGALDTAVTSIIDKLTQMRERMLEWGSGSIESGKEDETNLSMAVSYLQVDISNIVSKTTFGGKNLLSAVAISDATTGTKTFNFVNNAFDFNGDLEFKLDNMSMIQVVNQLFVSKATSLSSTISAASDAVKKGGDLYNALSIMRNVQADIGLAMQRIDDSITFVDNNIEVTSDAINTVRDADMAKEMTTYVKQNVLAQASQAMLAQANSGYASVLNLLSA